MQPPEGLSCPTFMVCNLKKSFYGLKQASRQWFAKLHSKLVRLGFHQSKQDYSLFIKSFNDLITIVTVYVDDIIITGDDISTINTLKGHLHNTFSIKDLGIISFFLGIEVNHLPTSITLNQRKSAQELLRDSDLTVLKIWSLYCP